MNTDYEMARRMQKVEESLAAKQPGLDPQSKALAVCVDAACFIDAQRATRNNARRAARHLSNRDAYKRTDAFNERFERRTEKQRARDKARRREFLQSLESDPSTIADRGDKIVETRGQCFGYSGKLYR